MNKKVSKLPLVATLATLALLGWARQAGAQIPATERQALLDLYASTNGPNWANSTNWNGAEGTECTWAGVACDRSQTTVIALNLRINNVVGTLPVTLGNLTGLQFLYLDSNTLTGSIPSSLANLTSLQALDLYQNQLTGSIPAELGNLTNLLVLYLKANQLSGSIPATLGSLTNLQSLELQANQLSGSIPPELGNLANLTDLELYWNRLTGSIPSELGNLISLRDLYLLGNRLSGPIPASLGNLTSLQRIELSDNQLSGSIPPQLSNLTSLVGFRLASNQLVGEVPSGFTNLTQLVSLDLNWNGLYSSDQSVTTFLNSRQANWQSTQTVPVTNLAVGVVTPSSVALTWTPIADSGGTGGYQVFYATTSGGPYTLSGTTADKTAIGYTVTGLTLGMTYYFIVKSVTYPNSNNQNTVVSDPSAVVQATTSSSACTPPSITSQPLSTAIAYGQTATLSVAATGTTPFSYQWYQGSSGDTSTPVGTNTSSFTTQALTTTTSYWVRISNACGQADSATATVTTGSIPASERQALLDLYTSTNGPGWITSTNWNGAAGSECAWLGVTCESSQPTVRSLDLHSNNLEGALPATLGNLTNLQSILLSSNQLVGVVPTNITDLTNLVPGTNDFRWNGLYSADPTVVAFLDIAQTGGDWQSTQTVPVTNLTVSVVTASSVALTWTPIAYTEGTGGYRIFYATTSGGPYTLSGLTADKTVARWTVTGLSAETTYYFIVESVTYPNSDNQNTVVSDPSVELSATTAPLYQLVVTKGGAGSGWVTSDPQGIDCGATCSAPVSGSTTVTLTATPTGGGSFLGWSGDCIGPGPCSLFMDAPKSVVATFGPAEGRRHLRRGN